MSEKLLISPSIMCCSIFELMEYVKVFEEKNVTSIHFDVMDGHFVNNIMLGTSFYHDLANITLLPIDIHLMCNNPEKYLSYFNPRKGDWISFHPETCRHPHRFLLDIKALGCKAGIVLNPGTTINIIDEVYDLLDFIVVMAVNPGFAGQIMVESHIEKLNRIISTLKKYDKNVEVIVDGNTNIENARRMFLAGATGVVVGSSSLLKSVNGFRTGYDEYINYVTSNQL